ncbi:MAG TPA: hypothetical protein VD967_02850 [Candidatus Paceibacterota bacterium]|nr:hypothetical protein [Candidatus Paceibacterota bacterium]
MTADDRLSKLNEDFAAEGGKVREALGVIMNSLEHAHSRRELVERLRERTAVLEAEIANERLPETVSTVLRKDTTSDDIGRAEQSRVVTDNLWP